MLSFWSVSCAGLEERQINDLLAMRYWCFLQLMYEDIMKHIIYTLTFFTPGSIHNCCLLNLCFRCTLHPHLLLVRLHSGNVRFIRISDMGRCYWLDSDFVGHCWSGCDYDRNALCYGRIAWRGRLNIYPLLSQQ